MAFGKFLILLAVTVTLVRADGKSLSELIDGLQNEREEMLGDDPNVDQKIKEIFGDIGKDTQSSTSAPINLQPTGIPGTGSCSCVPYYLCNNGSINTNGEGVIDIR